MQQNVLVTSISRKVPLLQILKRAIQKLSRRIVLIGGDIDQQCIGKYFVDHFWHMPLLDEMHIQDLIKYCKQHTIGLIIPTRDGELPYFAKYRAILEANGIHVMISSEQAILTCLDKLHFFEKLQTSQYPVIPTVVHIDDTCASRYVVKERYGAGSQKIGINLAKEEARVHARTLSSPIFQPYITGEEFSVDMYVDKKGTIKGVVARRRDVVVQGESQISTTVRNVEMEDVCVQIAQNLGVYGHIIFQVLYDKQGNFHIIECNPRFGGASALSIASGLDSFYWCYLEAIGEDITKYPFVRSKKEKRLVRYANDLLLDV